MNVSITKTLALAIAFAVSAAANADAETAGPWVDGFKNQARLIAGEAARNDEAKKAYAAIEIAMPEGWKTYWRAPGDAGGIPPEFDFSGSENLASAMVLYPAPKQLTDRTGTTFGYKDHVLFPIAIEAKDTSKPIHLRLKAAYGICEELCVPAEAELDLKIDKDAGDAPGIVAALSHVPTKNPVKGRDPIVEKVERIDVSGKPTLRITASDADAKSIHAFVDNPEGIYLPVAKAIKSEDGEAVFDLDLSDGVDLKDLSAKPITITLVSASSQSETTVALPGPAANNN